MHFLQIILFFTLYIYTSDSKLNFHKTNHKRVYILFVDSNDLPIMSFNRILIPRFYKLKFNGTDDRFPAMENITEETKYKIFKNLENKHKLDILQNEYISIYDKLELLNDRSIKPHNLEAGGLYKEYNFDL